MMIAVYETQDDVPQHRRFSAQFEKISNRLNVVCHGATAEEARQKAQVFWDAHVAPHQKTRQKAAPVETVGDLGDLLV